MAAFGVVPEHVRGEIVFVVPLFGSWARNSGPYVPAAVTDIVSVGVQEVLFSARISEHYGAALHLTANQAKRRSFPGRAILHAADARFSADDEFVD